MKKGAIAAVVVVALVAVVGIGGLLGAPSQNAASANQRTTETMPGWAQSAIQGAQDARNAATNEAIDRSGIKQKVQQALLDHSSDIAAQTGVSESVVNSAIDQMDIPDWKVTSAPSNAQVQSTNQVSAEGISGQITTYTDPSIISVSGMGQDITLSVPQSAQPYVGYLQYLS